MCALSVFVVKVTLNNKRHVKDLKKVNYNIEYNSLKASQLFGAMLMGHFIFIAVTSSSSSLLPRR